MSTPFIRIMKQNLKYDVATNTNEEYIRLTVNPDKEIEDGISEMIHHAKETTLALNSSENNDNIVYYIHPDDVKR